jgi:hypothetical protein
MSEQWERELVVNGERYTAVFLRRPFREGLEVYVECNGTVISVPELGLGEAALLEKVRQLIEEHQQQR